MFITIEISHEKGSIKSRFHDLFYPPTVKIEKVQVPNSKSFFKLTAKTYRGIVPWRTIEAKASMYHTRVLLKNELKIPDEIKLIEYKSKVLKSRLLFNSSLNVLETMALNPCEVFVCVIDENAYMVDLVEKIVPHIARLSIVTNCLFEYEKLANKLMQNYGISTVIKSKVDDNILNNTLIISPNSSDIPLVYSGLLFTNEKRNMMNATILTGHGINLQPQFEKFCPATIDKLDFACALYELCGADEIGLCCFEKMISGWQS